MPAPQNKSIAVNDIGYCPIPAPRYSDSLPLPTTLVLLIFFEQSAFSRILGNPSNAMFHAGERRQLRVSEVDAHRGAGAAPVDLCRWMRKQPWILINDNT